MRMDNRFSPELSRRSATALLASTIGGLLVGGCGLGGVVQRGFNPQSDPDKTQTYSYKENGDSLVHVSSLNNIYDPKHNRTIGDYLSKVSFGPWSEQNPLYRENSWVGLGFQGGTFFNKDLIRYAGENIPDVILEDRIILGANGTETGMPNPNSRAALMVMHAMYSMLSEHTDGYIFGAFEEGMYEILGVREGKPSQRENPTYASVGQTSVDDSTTSRTLKPHEFQINKLVAVSLRDPLVSSRKLTGINSNLSSSGFSPEVISFIESMSEFDKAISNAGGSGGAGGGSDSEAAADGASPSGDQSTPTAPAPGDAVGPTGPGPI